MNGVFNLILKELFPGVESEVKFHSTRKWKFDYAWPKQRLALEIEGGIWMAKGAHNTGKAILRDMEKYNEATLLGWRVLRITHDDIKKGKAIELLERAFGKKVNSVERR